LARPRLDPFPPGFNSEIPPHPAPCPLGPRKKANFTCLSSQLLKKLTLPRMAKVPPTSLQPPCPPAIFPSEILVGSALPWIAKWLGSPAFRCKNLGFSPCAKKPP